MLSGEFNKTVLTSDLDKAQTLAADGDRQHKVFPLSVEMVSVSWNKAARSSGRKPSCPCPTQSEIHPGELMVCSLEMGAFWDKNSLRLAQLTFLIHRQRLQKMTPKLVKVFDCGAEQEVPVLSKAAGKQQWIMTPEWLVLKCETDGFVSSPLLKTWTNSKQSQMFESNVMPHLHVNQIKRNQLHPEIVRNKQQSRKWRQWLKTLCDSSVMCGGFLTNSCSKQLPAGTGNRSDVSQWG